MKRLFLITCILLFYNSIYAQKGSIYGKVFLKGGEPLSHVSVRIGSENIAAVTDMAGVYQLTNVPYGSYELSISSVEIESKKIKIHVNKPREQLDIQVEAKGTVAIEEVNINKKSVKKELETKGFAVNVIETQRASLQSIQTNELLDRSAGVRIRQDGGLGSHIHYTINGMGGNAVKVFIDGVPSNNYGSSFSLNSIPPALIERIEIYKGVVPAHLSEDVLGGAINVIMKKDLFRNSLITSYSLGSFNTHQWNMTGNFRQANGLVVNASAFYNHSDNDYRVWGESIAFKDYTGATTSNQSAKRFHDGYRSFGGRFAIGYSDVSWADRFLVGAVLSDEYNEVQHGRTMHKPYGDRHTEANTNVATLTYEKRDLLIKGLDLKMDGSYSFLKRQVIDTVGRMYDWRGHALQYPDGSYVTYGSGAEASGAKTLGINSDKTLVSRFNLGYRIHKNHRLYANYFFNNFKRGTSDAMQPKGIQLLEDTRDLQKNIASLTYENLAFNDKLRTNVFYKHYFQKVTSNEPYQISANPPQYGLSTVDKRSDHSGYGLALAYEVNSNLYLLGSAEKAIRLPSANEIFGNVADNLLPPTNDLKPEKSYNANIGVNWSALTTEKHTLRLNSSVIYRNTQGMIREGLQSGNNDNTRFENLEDVETKGIDAEIVYSYARKIDFTFNVSKISSLFNTEFNENGAPYLYYRTQIRNEPSFKYNVDAVYYFNNMLLRGSKTSVYYNLNYVEKFLRNWANIGNKNLDEIPTQFSHDIGLAYTLPSQKMTISIDAKNISNQQIFDNFGLQKPGRSFYAKITYSIL